MNLASEKELVQKAKKDPQTFGVLFDRHYEQILNYCLRRVGDLATAEDITSTVFVKAYEKLWQFNWRGVPFLAWLYRIAGNEVKTYYRKGKNSLVSLEDLKELSGFEPSVTDRVEKEMIEKENELRDKMIFMQTVELIKGLDDKYQEVIQLRFFEQKKVREIAMIVDKQEGTVKSLLSRGIKKLRDKLMLSGALRQEDVSSSKDNRDNFAQRNKYKYYFAQLLNRNE